MIKLKSFEIKSTFKNLDNLKINFERCNGITVLIGNNGSGKSNIIEALSSVFAGLYDNHFNPIFSYELEYEKDEAVNKVKYDHTKGRNKYVRTLSDPENYLPTQIISIYSGEELRLWNRYYFKFYDDFMKDVIKSEKSYTEKQKMVFINKYYWNTALLTMLISDLDISEILGDRKIDRIEFEFKSNNIANITKYNTQNPNDVTRFAKNIFDISNEIPDSEKRTITLEEFKDEVVQTHSDLFKLLSISILPREDNWKLINKLELLFEDGYSTDELSEGEKKQILIKFVTRIFADDNSLLLMDEPDSHIHISNKEAIKNLLYDLEDKVHVQSILTTHSPTLTHCFDNDNVFMLVNKDGKIVLEDKTKLEMINDLTSEFWNLQEQNIFNSSQKPIILLVEGKHDKTHIRNAHNELKEEYPDLDFDIFNMGGADNIEHFVKGFYSSEIRDNKLYICILDNDEKGIEVNTELKKSLKPFPNFDVFMYPKKKIPNHKGAFTVENLFKPEHYENAFKTALAEYSFEKKSINTISENIQLRAKGRLATLSDDFDKAEFENFKFVFDKIKEIKEAYVPVVEQTQTSNETVVVPQIELFLFKNAKATFNQENEALTLLSGSKINKEYTPATLQPYKVSRDALIASLNHTNEEDEIVINEDYTFESPSGGAKFVNGGNRNGWTTWKNESGESLKDKFKAE